MTNMGKRAIVVLGILLAAGIGVVILEPTRIVVGYLKGENFFLGRPTGYWQRALQASDPAAQQETRQTLRSGGSAAVPVLVELLADKGRSDWDTSAVRWTAAD